MTQVHAQTLESYKRRWSVVRERLEEQMAEERLEASAAAEKVEEKYKESLEMAAKER